LGTNVLEEPTASIFRVEVQTVENVFYYTEGRVETEAMSEPMRISTRFIYFSKGATGPQELEK
jgi:hypothetical protein